MALATSAGVPSRPSGVPALSSAWSSPATSQAATARSDATPPTAMQLARMPWGPHSAAVTRVNIWSAAFDDE
jgi:hypothetical protein